MDVKSMDALDLKIKKIREKNALISKRHKEVERDKEEAQKQHAMVNVCAPTEDWTSHHLADAVPPRRESVPSRRDAVPNRYDSVPVKRESRPRGRHPEQQKPHNSDIANVDRRNAEQEIAWRTERDKVDRERISRQKTADGWKREWDREKSPLPQLKTADSTPHATGPRPNMTVSPSKCEPVSSRNKDMPNDSCNKNPPRPIRHCNFPPPEELKFNMSGLSPEAQSVMSRLNHPVDSRQSDTNVSSKMMAMPQFCRKEDPIRPDDVFKSQSEVPDISRLRITGSEPKSKLPINARQSDSKSEKVLHIQQHRRKEFLQPSVEKQKVDDAYSMPDLVGVNDGEDSEYLNVSTDVPAKLCEAQSPPQTQDISVTSSDESGHNISLNDSGRKVLFSGMSTQVCIQNDSFVSPGNLNVVLESIACIVEKPSKIMFPVSSTETFPPQSTDEKWFESNQDPASPRKQTVEPVLLSNHDSDSDDYWSDVPTSQESDEDESPPPPRTGSNNMVIKINLETNTREVQGEK